MSSAVEDMIRASAACNSVPKVSTFNKLHYFRAQEISYPKPWDISVLPSLWCTYIRIPIYEAMLPGQDEEAVPKTTDVVSRAEVQDFGEDRTCTCQFTAEREQLGGFLSHQHFSRGTFRHQVINHRRFKDTVRQHLFAKKIKLNIVFIFQIYYYLLTQCFPQPIEMTSSIYDTSASFYSNHSIHPLSSKLKRSFFSSVRGFLTSRKS